MPDIRRIVILIKAPCLMRLRFYLNGHKPVKTQSGHLETALSPQGLAFRPPCGSPPPYNKEMVLMAVPSGQEIAGVIIVVACTIFGLIMFLRAAKAEQEERKFEDYKLWDRL